MKFVADSRAALGGFWHAVKGAVITGTLQTHVPASHQRKAFYVLSADAKSTSEVKTRDGELRRCVDGERVAVSAFRKLDGLARYVGHRVRIELVDIQKLANGRDMFVFDVDVSDQPVRDNESEEVTDGDIPF